MTVVGRGKDANGYPTAYLTNSGTVRVHRLVAKAFLDRSHPDHVVVNHINHIKDDNRMENLEWTTQAQNMAHAADAGRMVPPPLHQGVAQHCAKLNPAKVREMRRRYYEEGATFLELAEEHDVAVPTARRAIIGRTWKHVRSHEFPDEAA